MCLITYWKKPKIAKKNIVCYKILEDKGLNGLYSPHTQTKYSTGLNKAYGETIIYRGPILNHSIFKRKTYMIERGMLHCCTTEGYSFEYLYKIFNNPFYHHIIYKCIIPKGTEYYISTDKKQICAKAIRLIKEF